MVNYTFVHVDHVIDEDFFVTENCLAMLTLVLNDDRHRRQLEERINTDDFGFDSYGFVVIVVKEIGIDGLQELYFILVLWCNNKEV